VQALALPILFYPETEAWPLCSALLVQANANDVIAVNVCSTVIVKHGFCSGIMRRLPTAESVFFLDKVTQTLVGLDSYRIVMQLPHAVSPPANTYQ
jgi:hypothetical protein